MSKPDDEDPIAEVRRIREEMWAASGYNMERWNQMIQEGNENWPAGRVSFDPNDPDCVPDTFRYSDLALRPLPDYHLGEPVGTEGED